MEKLVVVINREAAHSGENLCRVMIGVATRALWLTPHLSTSVVTELFKRPYSVLGSGFRPRSSESISWVLSITPCGLDPLIHSDLPPVLSTGDLPQKSPTPRCHSDEYLLHSFVSCVATPLSFQNNTIHFLAFPWDSINDIIKHLECSLKITFYHYRSSDYVLEKGNTDRQQDETNQNTIFSPPCYFHH